MKHSPWFILIAAIVLLAGCSKKDSPTSSNGSSVAPTVTPVTFAGPSTTSNDVHAYEAQSLALSANAYSSYFSIFASQQGTQNGNTWTWTWSYYGASVTFTGTQSANGYSWKWVYNGYDSSSQMTYTNWVFLQGTTSADGKTGTWTIYQDNSTNIAATYSWSVDANGNKTGTLVYFQDDGVTQEGKIVVINNADKTGEVDSYTGTTLQFKATWTATGSGQWWEYASDGSSTTGSWS